MKELCKLLHPDIKQFNECMIPMRKKKQGKLKTTNFDPMQPSVEILKRMSGFARIRPKQSEKFEAMGSFSKIEAVEIDDLKDNSDGI